MSKVMKIERFLNIEAWKAGRALTKADYEITREKRFSRDFSLIDQIRSAAISVTSNIAAGFERGGDNEFIQAPAIAKGSCGEVRSQLYVALDEQYIPPTQFDEISEKALAVSRLIGGFMKYLKGSGLRGSKFKDRGQAANLGH